MSSPWLVHVIQASYGDSLLLEQKNGTGNSVWILIDGGPASSVPLSGTWENVGYSLFKTLNELGVKTLDYIIVTHNDHDHVNGIAALLGSIGDPMKVKESTGTLGSGLDTISEVYSKNLVQWNNGYNSLNNSSKPVFPIGQIWYNDLSLVEYLYRVRSDFSKPVFPIDATLYSNFASNFDKVGLNKKGWCWKLLTELKKAYKIQTPRIKLMGYGEKDIIGIEIVGPGEPQFHDLLATSDSDRFAWHTAQDALVLKDRSTKSKKTPDEIAISIQNKWARVERKKSVDKEKKNKSSIMFEMVIANNTRILLTGDSTGTILHENVEKSNPSWNLSDPSQVPRRYKFMKLMHHGNSRNCYLGSTTGKTGETVIEQGCLEFFKTYAAETYCISGDTFSRVPNPDTFVLKAICRAHEDRYKNNTNEPRPIIWLTNGCTVGQVDEMLYHMDSATKPPTKGLDRKPQPVILFLQQGRDFGSIDPMTQNSEGWTWVQKADEAGSFHRQFIPKAFDLWVKLSRTHDSIHPDTKKSLDAMFQTASSFQPTLPPLGGITGSDPMDSYSTHVAVHIPKPAPKMARLLKQLDWTMKDDIDMKLFVSLNHVAAFNLGTMSSGGMGSTPTGRMRPAPPIKPQAINWHDLMIANLAGATIFDLGDFQDVPIAPATLLSDLTRDGGSPQWVDLSTLVILIEEYNFGEPPEGVTRLPENIVHALKFWYGPKTGASPSSEPILAVPLLRFFMAPSTLDNLLTQLPINANGLLEDELAFTTQTTRVSALSLLTVENFRAKIVLPSPEQKIKGEPLNIIAFHFELAPPPVNLLSAVSPSNVLQWDVPFENSVWKRGQVRLRHSKNLRVRILNPQYTNPVIYIHFDSVLRVNRGPLTADKESSFEVNGKMVAKGGPKQTATYDLLLSGDEKGTVSILDMFKLWAPSGFKASFAESLTRVFDNLEVPGIKNLHGLFSNTLRIEDCGIVLRQDRPGLCSVSVNDLYGTIQTSEAVGLAANEIGLPKLLVPQNLPDMTITFSGIAQKQSEVRLPIPQSIAFALDFDIEDLGFAVIQASLGDGDATVFDAWLVCNPGVNLKQMLALLELDHLASFEAAQLFTESIGEIETPFFHITLAKADDPIQELSFILNLPDFEIKIGELKALALEDLQLMLEYQSPPVKGGFSTIRAYGTAILTIAGFGATLKFSADPSGDSLDAFLSDEEPEPISGQTKITIDVDFGDHTPSLRDILKKLAGDSEIVGEIMKALPQPLVEAFNGLLDFLDYRRIEVVASRPAGTQKWTVSSIDISINMSQEIVAKLNKCFDGKFVLEEPVLDITILDPGNKDDRAWKVYLNCDIAIQGIINEIRANFYDPPPGMDVIPSEFGMEIECGVLGGRGLKLGDLVLQLTESSLGAAGLDVGVDIPDVLRNAISSVDVRAIRITFSEDPVIQKYKLKWLEALIEAGREPLKIIDNFELSDIMLHFTHNTGLPKSPAGVVPANEKSTNLSLNGNLKLGSRQFSAAVSHNTSTGSFTMSLTDLSAVGIDIIGLIADCIPDTIDENIADIVKKELSSIIKINISTFFIAYTPAKPAIKQLQSISFAQKGEVSILGIGSDSIEVICEKSVTWNATIAVAIASPCYPFKKLLGGSTDVFDGIRIDNGYFAFATGIPASRVTRVQPGAAKKGTLMFAGTLVFGHDGLLGFISKFIQVDSVDLLIAAVPPIQIEIGIQKNLKLFNGFTLTEFMFRLTMPAIIALGASVEIDADWLCDQPVTGKFALIMGADSSLGAEASVGEIAQPFGLNFLKLEGTFFSIVFLAAALSPKSIGFAAGVVLTVGTSIEARINASLDLTNPINSHFMFQLKNVTFIDIFKALTTGVGKSPKNLPAVFESPHINIGFKNLSIDIKPSGPKFNVSGQFYIFFLRGQVAAKVDLLGFRFAANLDKIDILGLVKVSSANNESIGPFVYLDTTVGSLTTGKGTAPDWINASSADDPKLVGAFFAITGKMKIFGSPLSVYGYVDMEGLYLVVASGSELSAPGVSLKSGTTLEISIDSDHFSGKILFSFDFSIDFAAIDFLNVGLGKLGNVGISFDSEVTLKVSYGTSQFTEEGLVFTARIVVEVLGVGINATLDLDVSVKELEDIPDAVKGFIEDEVVDGLEDVFGTIGKEFEELGEDIADGAKKTFNEVGKNFNIGAQEMAQAFMEAGYEINVIANMMKDGLDMTIDEVAGVLLDLGQDINDVANAVGDAFEAFPNEVASAIVSAGISIEHALDSAFNDAITELSGAFNLVGNSIVGFGEDAIDAIGDFITEDAKEFFEDLGGAIVDGLESVIDEVGDWFRDPCVVA